MKKRLARPHPVLRVIRIVSGVLLLLCAVIGGLLPIIQGWIFVLPGLALLAPESRLVRKAIVKIRTRLRLRRFRKWRRVGAAPAAPDLPRKEEH